MLTADVQQRLAALRQPARTIRIAWALWIAWAASVAILFVGYVLIGLAAVRLAPRASQSV